MTPLIPRGLVSAALVVGLTMACVTAPCRASPEQDRVEMIAFFQQRFPDVPLDAYINGALALSRDARAQFDSIMEFPPFQGEIDRGKRLWEKRFRNGRTFADCFASGGRGIAGNYPYHDGNSNRVVTFEMDINRCLRDNGESEFDYNDKATMGLMGAYARTLSDGMRVNVRVEGSAALAKYEQGKKLFFTRTGQYNFACASCHMYNAGKILRTEILSPALGHATHWPVFRGGDDLYTLHMRYRRCLDQMRATVFAAGSEELNNLEYFHSYLSNGLLLRASVYRK